MSYLRLLFILIFCSNLLEVSAQTVKKGGFIYGWDDFTSDETTGLGSRIVEWDSTDLVDIIHAPEIGVHPRVYFGPSEIPAIIDRLDNTTSGQQAKATIHAYTTLLHLGSTYNQSHPYALDPDGNRYIDNSGAWNMEPFYSALKAHDVTVWDGVPIKSKHRTAALMSLEAFMCLLYPDEMDEDVGVGHSTRIAELTDAMNFWATIAEDDPTVNPDGFNFNNFGGTHMALCYDLMYNYLSEDQKTLIRGVLSKIIPEHPRHGNNLTCYANTSNWTTLNTFELIINLAIEGEEGYNEILTKEWARTLHNFINYGWYPSGAGYEGLGKNYQFVTTLIVCAKRGYSLLAHPHVKAYGEEFLPAIMQPFGKGFTSYDVWGGSGNHPVTGQYKFNSADAVGLKWAFPESKEIDFVWRNYIDGFHKHDSRGYVYAQVFPDDSYNSYLIPAAVFASNYSDEGWQSKANEVIEENYIAMDRGLAVFKSSSDSNALSMQFHARQDFGGHTHGDRNDFTLSGLGRIWIRKSYGGSQFQTSKHHSMILIDDIGMAVGDPDGDKCRQPATILETNTSSEISTISADATYAYTWDWHWSPQPDGSEHPWVSGDEWSPVTESWNDFLPTPHPEAHYNTPFYEYPHWHQPNKYERMIKRLYNPMEKVVRNVAMLKGSHPMVLIVDDIQKDSETHNYKWISQIARDLELDYYDVNLENLNYKCDIVLKEPSETGNRRLLVRILNNENYDGTTDPGYIDTVDYVDFFTGSAFSPNPNWVRPRLIVESNSISPAFKVLIYPFESGSELPTTNWNESKDTLQILFDEDEKIVHFPKNELDNTGIELVSEEVDLGLNDETVISHFTLYPNPSEGNFICRSDKQLNSITISTISGQFVFGESQIKGNLYQGNLTQINSGIYSVQVEFEDGNIETKRLIIK